MLATRQRRDSTSSCESSDDEELITSITPLKSSSKSSSPPSMNHSGWSSTRNSASAPTTTTTIDYTAFIHESSNNMSSTNMYTDHVTYPTAPPIVNDDIGDHSDSQLWMLNDASQYQYGNNATSQVVGQQQYHDHHEDIHRSFSYQSDMSPSDSLYPSLMDVSGNGFDDAEFYSMMDMSILPKSTLSPSAPAFSDNETDSLSTTATTTTTTTNSSRSTTGGKIHKFSIVTADEYRLQGGNGPLPPYLLHKLDPDDTLIKLSLAYGVLEEKIKMANNILSDLSFYTKPEIIIPYPTCIPEKSIPQVEQDLEKKKREWALVFFVRLKGVSVEEATYYLSLHEYDFRHAVAEYDSDIKWEREFEAKKAEKKSVKDKRKRLEKWKSSTVYQFLTLCIPFIPQSAEDEYGNLELDEIDDGITEDHAL